MQKSKAIVIGGNGFIGRNICDKLLNQNYEVYSFDKLSPECKNPSINYINGDFFDDNSLLEAVEDKDIIIHSLSIMNPSNSNTDYLKGYQYEMVQSIKLFEYITKSNKKLIYLSSGGTVYGIQEQQPILETANPLPINHYGCLKLCIESTLRTFNEQSKKNNMLIARVANPYGPGQDFNKGVGFIDAAIKKTLLKTPIEIWGDGTVVRDYIYIDDIAEMISSLTMYNGNETVFNLSSGVGVSLNDILNELTINGLEIDVQYKPGRSVDVPKVILNNDKIKQIYRKELINIKDGLKKYCEYLKREEILVEEGTNRGNR